MLGLQGLHVSDRPDDLEIRDLGMLPETASPDVVRRIVGTGKARADGAFQG
jgi:hypothetical protein